MTTTMTRWTRAITTLVLLGLVVVPARAEVSVDISESGFNVIILGLTEGTDPWGMIWHPYRDIDEARILNPDGSIRGDGRPDVSNPESGTQIVVWAYQTGVDTDIALSEWVGTRWTDPLFLSDATTSESDPRVLVTGTGKVHVAWWVRQTKKLFLATRPPQSDVWGLPREIETPLGGLRPSLAEFQGKLHIAYEQYSEKPTAVKDIIVVSLTGAVGFDYVKVAETQRLHPNDAILHVKGDVAWVDWKHSANTFGYVVNRNGVWGATQTVPWTDQSWVGEEDTRRRIRSIVLGATEVDNDPGSTPDGLRIASDPPGPSARSSTRRE